MTALLQRRASAMCTRLKELSLRKDSPANRQETDRKRQKEMNSVDYPPGVLVLGVRYRKALQKSLSEKCIA